MFFLWDDTAESMAGSPTPMIFIHNVRAVPIGDGNLRLLLVDHPHHAACWDVMEEHGIGKEVELRLDDERYYYMAELGEDDAIYLIPMDDYNQELPPNERFLEKALNLRLRW